MFMRVGGGASLAAPADQLPDPQLYERPFCDEADEQYTYTHPALDEPRWLRVVSA